MKLKVNENRFLNHQFKKELLQIQNQQQKIMLIIKASLIIKTIKI